jgi:nicotinamidase-related amidase
VTAPWLVVIDMQNVFADAASPWYLPGFAEAATGIARLLPRFTRRVVFTRFIPPRDIEGSWRDYYDKWEFARTRAPEPLWALADPWADAPSVDSHQFSKFVPDLLAVTGRTPSLVLCGVSTDCCVLATALAAVDGGAHVRVVADACGAKTPVIHDQTLALLRSRAPMLRITTSQEELAQTGGAP